MTDMWQDVKLCHLMWNLFNGLVNEIRKSWLNHIFHYIKLNQKQFCLLKMHFHFKICFYFYKQGRGKRHIGQEDRYHRQDKGIYI